MFGAMKPRSSVAVIVLAVVAASCGVQPEVSTALIDRGIVIDDSKENTVPGVMWIGMCTSTAVSTNTLITAAHCVDNYRILENGKVVGNVSIHSGSHTGKRGNKLFVPPQYNVKGNMHMAYDVAVAVFDEGTFDNYFVMRSPQEPPRLGEKGMLVGYSPENPEPGARSNKRWGEITISQFLSNITIVSQFGGHAGAVAVSPGDSGGPAFSPSCEIYGVASRMSEGGIKESLHTNLSFQGNVEWLNSLAAEGAYICGLHGNDPNKCPAQGLNRPEARLGQGEFPCVPGGAGAAAIPDQNASQRTPVPIPAQAASYEPRNGAQMLPQPLPPQPLPPQPLPPQQTLPPPLPPTPSPTPAPTIVGD